MMAIQIRKEEMVEGREGEREEKGRKGGRRKKEEQLGQTS